MVWDSQKNKINYLIQVELDNGAEEKYFIPLTEIRWSSRANDNNKIKKNSSSHTSESINQCTEDINNLQQNGFGHDKLF